MFAEITSANIVGYQAADVRNLQSLQMPTFEAVSTTGKVNIQDIVPVGDFETGDYTIQITGNSGRLLASYTYYLEGESDAEDPVAGWYEDDAETLSTKVFDIGEGFKVFCNAQSGKIQFAGAVNTQEVLVPVRNLQSVQGNFRPTPVDIQKLIPVGEVETGDLTIQITLNSGRVDTTYTYYLEGESDAEDPVAGWYEDDAETLSTKVFEPGEGFLIFNNNSGCQLKFEKLDL